MNGVPLSRPMVLTGRYVQLERLRQEHAEGLAAAAARDRSSYAFTTVPDGLDGARAYIDLAMSKERAGRAVPFAVRRLSDDTVVGSTSLLDLDVFTWPRVAGDTGPVPDDEHPPTVAEIGSTWYAADAQRTPVNTECKLLLLALVLDTWRGLRVTLKTDARNARSRAAIERLGAQFEGVRRAHTPATDGGVRDTAYYSIVAAEWPDVRTALERRLER
ncbi:GNAT family N-acetyltransferase [Cellulomonas composti]|uniref:N-acetyltransferase n=1 Tax=Cellulomonas composti TaxID=266130 RepID=A0A511JE39_9CELL|nr:GNAT family N-acetyltransferase [Cellulomonas composti]GEL96003.1 N-acetyltransferase [Cellulomonas composti]